MVGYSSIRIFPLALALVGAIAAIGCGGSSDGTTGDANARLEALCSDWCTCSGDEGESCIDSCTRDALIGRPCQTAEQQRYIQCMVDAECSDPDNACAAGREDPQTCGDRVETDCEAECGDSQCTPAYTCYELCVMGVSCQQYDRCLIYDAEYDARCGNDCWYLGTDACVPR